MDAPQHARTEGASLASSAAARPGPALLALAIGAFAIGSTEFLMMGLLPEIAADLRVSVPAVGYAISAYALGVVVGAPTLTALSTRLPHQRVLTGLMALFVLGHAVTALAPGYDGLLVGRFVTGLSHGSFFGVAAVVASRLAPPGKAKPAPSAASSPASRWRRCSACRSARCWASSWAGGGRSPRSACSAW